MRKWIALMGAVIGLTLAGFEIVKRLPRASVSGEVLARVNGVAIARAAYEAILKNLTETTRAPISADVRERIVARMIDEELLIQKAQALGLVRRDRVVRGALVRAVIEAALEEVRATPPDEAVLRDFYATHKAFFTPARRARIQRIFLRGDDAARVEAVARALNEGMNFAEVGKTLGDALGAPLPDTLLPPSKIREYMGEALMLEALRLTPGERAGPIETESGIHFLHLVDKIAGVPPDFETIRAQIETRWRYVAEEEALRRYLEEARDEARIEIFGEIFDSDI